MGIGLGFRVGPLRVSTSLSGGGGRASREASDAVGVVLVVLAIAVGFFGFAPWLAIEAQTGRWGIVATVLGLAFLLASPLALVVSGWGSLVGTSWSLYVFWLAGYWRLAGWLFEWVTRAPEPSEMSGLDSVAFAAGALCLAVVQGLLTISIPVAASYLAAYAITEFLSDLRMTRSHASARDYAPRAAIRTLVQGPDRERAARRRGLSSRSSC